MTCCATWRTPAGSDVARLGRADLDALVAQTATLAIGNARTRPPSRLISISIAKSGGASTDRSKSRSAAPATVLAWAI
jgi:hypothetical protein